MSPIDETLAQVNADKVRRSYRVRFAQVLPSTVSPSMVLVRIGTAPFQALSVSEAIHMLRMAKGRERKRHIGAVHA